MTPEDQGLRARFQGRQRFTTSSGRRPRRAEWRFAGFLRKRPGSALAITLAAALSTQILLGGFQTLAAGGAETEHRAWIHARALSTLEDVLAVIGDDVSISTLEVQSMREGVLGSYLRSTRTVTITDRLTFADNDLLEIMAHEVVHAMFDQKDWHSYYGLRNQASYVLKEETAAYVLGAHIAGLAKTRRRGDGAALAEKLVSDYRSACDPMNPHSVHRWVSETHNTEASLSADRQMSISVHFGSPKLVDEIDQICRNNPDPWDAALVIAETYLMPDREEAEKNLITSSWLPERHPIAPIQQSGAGQH